MTTTTDIFQIISNNPHTKNICKGIFPSNLLPRILVEKPSAYITNLDEHYKPGSHWVTIFFPSFGPAEYFDSFGAPPNKSSILLFLDRNSPNTWVWNSERLQSTMSDVCGQYVIYFILCRIKGFSMRNFHALFHGNDYAENDRSVRDMVKQMV
jgi:hypothetical protein